MKRPPKTKAKTLSLSSPVGDPEDLWLQEGDRRKLRPIVDSVFGQVGHSTGIMSAQNVYLCFSAFLKVACLLALSTCPWVSHVQMGKNCTILLFAAWSIYM